jgi:hypothetical protein
MFLRYAIGSAFIDSWPVYYSVDKRFSAYDCHLIFDVGPPMRALCRYFSPEIPNG